MTREPSATPFHDLDTYLELPRAGGLALSPDGTRLVVGLSELNHDATSYATALWEVDPRGEQSARRLTRGLKGEGKGTFTASGDLLFIAKRPTADVPEEDAKPGLWCLPAAGGEAVLVASRPGGISGVLAACAVNRVVVSSDTLPAARDEQSEKELRDARSEAKVDAILHTGYPVRYWDRDLGPEAPRLFALEGDEAAPHLRDLTPDAGPALIEGGQDLSADGTTIVTTWRVPMARGAVRTELVRIDVASGERTTILTASDAEFRGARISPDGARIAYVREEISSAEQAGSESLWVANIDGSEPVRLAPGWDRWPAQHEWLPDGSGLLVTADDDGRRPVFLVTCPSGSVASDVTQLTYDAAAYTDVVVAPDGRAAYALRSSYEFPSEVVRIALPDGAGGPGGSTSPTDVAGAGTGDSGVDRVTALNGPTERPELPGQLREVETVTHDGVRVRSWLALPHGASADAPAPLLLWIHGGPLGSWNAWSWRWCPWLLVARGYAVLLPDPALSTGYGQDFIQRGWGAWGREPFTDLMAATDAVVGLPEIDADRTAAMGGSFGGYMANWIAGHTDRFRAIVTHASLWALDQFGPTTDASFYWAREMTPDAVLENSPHLSVENISTPMLVIHGDKDYRVPIGEGLRLWYELLSRSQLAADDHGHTPHRFLFFPEENHWILSPQHTKVWYQVIEGFLGEHVLDLGPAEVPKVLGTASE